MIDTHQRFDPWVASPAHTTLLQGTYPSADARDLARELLDSSGRFLKLRKLCNQVHGQRDDDSTRSLIDLAELRARLDEVLARASAEGKSVRLHASLELELVEDGLSR